MPVYDYECRECGVFTALRPMSECREPLSCLECGKMAPRVFLSMPAIAGMDPARRTAIAVNERSSHEPRFSRAHGNGCACCSAKGGKTTGKSGGAKSFPKARPWMISH